ncbi:MAG: CHAP domain-containing protein [bacterium]|nr:CHAP domain-containing protein [bacterium]
MITLQEFVAKWIGKEADYDGAYAGQCVDLFRYYNKEVLSIPQPKGVRGAADFWTNYDSDPVLNENFTKIKNTLEFIPEEGDVVIWTRREGGGFGHIAIFLSGDINKFVSFDQNYPTLSVCTETEHNYTNVYGVLRPKKSSGDEKIYTEVQMTEVRLQRDENWNRSEEWRKKYEGFIQKASDVLGSLVLPDETNIIVNLKTLVTVGDQLKKVKDQLKEALESKEREMKELKNKYESRLNSLALDNEKQAQAIERLQNELKTMKETDDKVKEERSFFEWVSEWFRKG